MATNQPIKLRGCTQFRQRIVFSTLSSKRIRIDNIRDKDEAPGLRDFEASFLRLVDKLTNGCKIEINETGTSMKYAPGLISGGIVEHDCGTSRSIGWFIEGILPLLPFAKKATSIVFTGITNDDADFSVDTLKLIHLPLLPHFGISEELKLDIKKRGAAPLGGGLVTLTCPIVRELKSINFIDEGYVKRIRGVAFTSKVSPQLANRMVDGARGLLNPFLPDVYVYTDHNKGDAAGKSPGFGLTLVATTTSGCIYGSQRASSAASGIAPALALAGGNSAHSASSGPVNPEDTGADCAGLLLDEIARGGCIDTGAQPLVFTLMVLCPEDVSRVRIGQISPAGIATLRLIREFFGVVFKLSTDVQESKPAPKPAKSAGSKRKDGEDAEGADADVAAGSINKRKRREVRTAGGDDFDGNDGAAEEEEEAAQPVTSAVVGGHSGKTVLVSCMGTGYKNYAKKVT